jgi:glycosyltransferase involved in cell wall biosynthesis
MSTFQILCVTMNQNDFSKIKQMNIHSNVIFANQTNINKIDYLTFENHIATMISTNTKGVGVNRNIALMYADSDICLLADDDIRYYDNVEKKVMNEFEKHPDADVFIFHLDTDVEERQLEKYCKTRSVHKFDKKPWGAVRVAFRLKSIMRSNIWFSTLFGGGAKFPCGEDSIWIEQLFKCGLKFYVSKETIGFVSCKESTWFTGYDEKRFFAAGALYAYLYRQNSWIWKYYFAIRTKNKGVLSFKDKCYWIQMGIDGYRNDYSFEELKDRNNIK